MAQIKIYGLREHLDPVKQALSNVIHTCVVDMLAFPKDKRPSLAGDEIGLPYKVDA